MPVPVVYWPHYHNAKWLISGFIILWTFVLWFVPGNMRLMDMSFYMLFWPIQLYFTLSSVRQVMTNGVLSVVRTIGTVQHVPLAVAEIKRTVTGAVRFRWTEGRRPRSVATNPSIKFLAELKRAAAAARSAAPGSMPATEAAAAQGMTFGFPPPATLRFFMLGLTLLAVFVGAMLWEQPLLLLPMAVIALFIDRKATNYMLMLSDEHLWVLRPDEAPHPIPLTAVGHVSDGIQAVVITTSDATYPQISASGYRSGDLLKELKHRR